MATAEVEIPKHYVTTYRDNVALLVQQKRSRFEGTVNSYSGYTGEKASPVHQFGQTAMRKLEGRHEDTPIMTVPRDRRWIFPEFFDWGDLIDSKDKMQMMIDPTSPLTMAGVAAANRKKDEVIIAAFFGDAKTGQNGGTNVPFPGGSTNLVGTDVGGTASGVNFDKIVAGLELLGGAEDLEDDDNVQVYMGLNKKLNSMLLRQHEAASREFDKYGFVIQDGKVRQGLGVRFVHSEKFAVAANVVDLPMWTNTGMHLGFWEDMKVQAFLRSDKKNYPQIMIDMACGASRLEESRVIKIQATQA